MGTKLLPEALHSVLDQRSTDLPPASCLSHQPGEAWSQATSG